MASRKTSNQQRKRPECHTPDLTITQDKYKGRSPKLNSEQVEQLKQRIEAGESKASVAKAFEITRMTVYSYLKSN